MAKIDTEHETGEQRRSASRSRRALLSQAMRVSAGLALAGGASGLPGLRAAAQDRTITLTGAASQLIAAPGEAAATGAVASAAATRGLARVQAAAALAGADSGGETFAEGAATLSVADPNRGAVAQSAVAIASALDEEDGGGMAPQQVVSAPTAAPAPGGRGGRGGGGGRAARGGRGGAGRTIQAGGRRRQRDQVAALPVAGTGDAARPNASIFGLASAMAAVGAFVMRSRGQAPELASHGVPVVE